MPGCRRGTSRPPGVRELIVGDLGHHACASTREGAPDEVGLLVGVRLAVVPVLARERPLEREVATVEGKICSQAITKEQVRAPCVALVNLS